MRQIKFKGIEALTGREVYGYFLGYDKLTNQPIIGTLEQRVEVKDDSPKQMVGYDGGLEVYEDDWIKPRQATDDFAYKASFSDYDLLASGQVRLLGYSECLELAKTHAAD